MIDTGAQMTAIRADIPDRLRLAPIGVQNVYGGISAVPQRLPVVLGVVLFRTTDGARFSASLEMTKSPLANAQMLFGMDAMEGTELLVDFAAHRWEWKIVRVSVPGSGGQG